MQSTLGQSIANRAAPSSSLVEVKSIVDEALERQNQRLQSLHEGLSHLRSRLEGVLHQYPTEGGKTQPAVPDSSSRLIRSIDEHTCIIEGASDVVADLVARLPT